MRQHKEQKGFTIYGRNAVHETLAHTPDRLSELFVIEGSESDKNEPLITMARAAGIQVTRVDKNKAEKLFGFHRTQGIGAYHRGFQYRQIADLDAMVPEGKNAVVLMLDHVEDVQNFGAMVRTAMAVGALAVIVAEHEQAPVTGAVFAASAGTAARMPIIQVSSIAQVIAKLKEKEFWTYAIDMEDDTKEYPAGSLWQQKFDAHTAIVVGAEGKGLSKKAKENCDFVSPIPMEDGVESLNVSVAAAVALYEWKRQQG